jgi:hypothetical protein
MLGLSLLKMGAKQGEGNREQGTGKNKNQKANRRVVAAAKPDDVAHAQL